jgi:hypothetical protein
MKGHGFSRRLVIQNVWIVEILALVTPEPCETPQRQNRPNLTES